MSVLLLPDLERAPGGAKKNVKKIEMYCKGKLCNKEQENGSEDTNVILQIFDILYYVGAGYGLGQKA